MIEKIYFATTNKGKLREAREILEIKIEGLDVEVDEIQTLDPEECALKKAEKIYEKCQIPVLIEDTALFFEAWKGLPGVFIDYFLKTVGNKGLLKMLENETNRNATAQTTLVFYQSPKKYQIFKGMLKGTIAKKVRGENGFGWDAIFIPEGYNKTFAELETTDKNGISMRKRALEEFKKTLLS